jgi:8-hydroxy-5-deazaflavin:NADPH oxidoreductase
MKIAVLGTGNVGQTFATRLIALGHDVMMGTRDVADTLDRKASNNYGSLPFSEWHNQNNSVQLGTFAQAVAFGDIIINALKGSVSISALMSVKSTDIDAKILMDISNPLDFSQGFPPTLLEGLNNESSLGEKIQASFPNAKVVKTLNTMYSAIMVNPGMVNNGDHNVFVSGNDTDAKRIVKEVLESFGWTSGNILDLGDITTSRGTEMYLPLWLRVYGATNNGAFNIKIVS